MLAGLVGNAAADKNEIIASTQHLNCSANEMIRKVKIVVIFQLIDIRAVIWIFLCALPCSWTVPACLGGMGERFI